MIFAERLAELRKELAGYRNGARWMRAEGYPHAAEGADQDARDALAEIRILEAKAWGTFVLNDFKEGVVK